MILTSLSIFSTVYYEEGHGTTLTALSTTQLQGYNDAGKSTETANAIIKLLNLVVCEPNGAALHMLYEDRTFANNKQMTFGSVTVKKKLYKFNINIVYFRCGLLQSLKK